MPFRKSVIGLDIGTYKTKFVHLKSRRGKYEILDYGFIDNPADTVDNGNIIQPELLGERIRELVQDFKLTDKTTISSVSGPQVYIRNIIMPKMKLKDLRQAIYYQATTFLPIPIEEAIIDIFPIRDIETDEGLQTEVFFVAVRKQQVENLEMCAKIAGLNLQVIDLESLALKRVIADISKFKTKAILNLGATRSGFTVFEDKNLLFHRPLAFGSTGGDQPGELLTEITRSIEYYNMQFKSYPETIILCGNIINFTEIEEMLSKNINALIQIGEIDPNVIKLDKLNQEDYKLLQSEYLIALGLAIRGKFDARY
ncbi:MAG TPA: pilus assembly protein PilM [Syntrophomonadaceae bacterium]|nr:pilus assembly protein PilM [Syntrophomonadaceae bacterium]